MSPEEYGRHRERVLHTLDHPLSGELRGGDSE
jgi:hypothetical protein